MNWQMRTTRFRCMPVVLVLATITGCSPAAAEQSDVLVSPQTDSPSDKRAESRPTLNHLEARTPQSEPDEGGQTRTSTAGPSSTIDPVTRDSKESPSKPHWITFSDDFQTDSRSGYEVSGTVDWEPGRVILRKGASIRKEIDLGAVAEMTLRLDWRPLEKGETSGVEIGFVTTQGIRVAAQLARASGSGKVITDCRIVRRALPSGSGGDTPANGAARASFLGGGQGRGCSS